jgi:hypothetical protein
MKNKDFISLLKLDQAALKKELKKRLQAAAYDPIDNPGYLYAWGPLPILLVAHMDTVHRDNVSIVCQDAGGRILWSPQGIGGDDRAGAWLILQILAAGLRPSIVFTEDEETGAAGARAFAADAAAGGLKYDYIVEFDRRGANDCVFYNCHNEDFIDFVESFGFREAAGSFSDISVIAPKLGAAAVNISCGFYNEHSIAEYIDMDVIADNSRRAMQMLLTPCEGFKYIEQPPAKIGYFYDHYCSSGGAPKAGRKKDEPVVQSDADFWPDDAIFIEPYEHDPKYYVDECGDLYEYVMSSREYEARLIDDNTALVDF